MESCIKAGNATKFLLKHKTKNDMKQIPESSLNLIVIRLHYLGGYLNWLNFLKYLFIVSHCFLVTHISPEHFFMPTKKNTSNSCVSVC